MATCTDCNDTGMRPMMLNGRRYGTVACHCRRPACPDLPGIVDGPPTTRAGAAFARRHMLDVHGED